MFGRVDRSNHLNMLSRSLNVAVLLCEENTVMPPGFFLECELAYEVVLKKKALIDAGLVILPRREISLERLIEKKRSEYAGVREKFEGLFDDRRAEIFSDTQPIFVKRNTKIGASATLKWEEGPDVSGTTWDHLKQILSHEAIEVARTAPRTLLENGDALTWAALVEHLNAEVVHHEDDVRLYLQRNYFTLYVDEFELVVLRDVPYLMDEFFLPSPGAQYSYKYFSAAASTLGIPWLRDVSAETIARLKRSDKFIRFIDSYVQVVALSSGLSNMTTILGRAMDSIGFPTEFQVQSTKSRTGTSAINVSDRETDALVDALDSLANQLETDLNLVVRHIDGLEKGEQKSFEPWNNPMAVRRSDTRGRREHRLMKNVVLATANQRETKAVLAAIKEHQTGSQEQPRFVGRQTRVPRWEVPMKTKHGEVKLSLSQADETGGDEAVDLLRRVVAEVNPDTVFFVGCAALLDEKAEHRENLVYLARRGIDSDKAELKDGEVYYDMDQLPGDLLTRRNFSNLSAGGVFAPVNLVTNRDFISGSVFLGDRSSKRRKDLVKKFPPDAVVLEMEAFQLYKELYRMRSYGEGPAVSVIKGISDLGDEGAQSDKDKTQKLATTNATTVVLRYLMEIAG